MKIYRCPKCNSSDVFTETNGSQIGLYCGDCGKWIKWVNKDEARLVKRQGTVLKEEIVKQLSDDIKQVKERVYADFKNI